MKAIYQGVRYQVNELIGDDVVLVDGPAIRLSDPDLIIDPTDSQWEVAKEGEPAWVYNETDHKDLPPGLYLGLFHGRKSRDEVLEDWGSNGPIIGPLKFVHTTYAHHIQFEFTSAKAHNRYFKAKPSSWIPGKGGAQDEITSWEDLGDFVLEDDSLEYNGVFYGDWTVFIAP